MQRKSISFLALFTFIFNMALPYGASAQAITPYGLPQPQQLLNISKSYSYPVLKGVKINPDNPAYLEFIIDAKDRGNIDRQELSRLISYFLACLTIPEADLWVNLSPYEQNRILSEKLAQTDLGKDMLGQDYVLKQLASSLTYPESEAGKKYWDAVNTPYGGHSTTGSPAVQGALVRPSLMKVWIVPDKALIYEHNGTAVIKDSQLKVIMEEDYLAVQQNNVGVGSKPTRDNGQVANLPLQGSNTNAFKTHILPLIEKEVNTGENFARLRQIHNAFLLATWFKKKLKDSAYKYYIDQGKVKGIDLKDKNVKENIYNLYVEAFKKGAYNYVKKEFATPYGGNSTTASSRASALIRPSLIKITKRQYFSGGVRESSTDVETKDNVSGVMAGQQGTLDAGIIIEPKGHLTGAMKEHDIPVSLALLSEGEAQPPVDAAYVEKFEKVAKLAGADLDPIGWYHTALKAYLLSHWPLQHAANILAVKSDYGRNALQHFMLQLLPPFLAFKYDFLMPDEYALVAEAINLFAQDDYDAADTMLMRKQGIDLEKARAILMDAQREFNNSPNLSRDEDEFMQMMMLDFRFARPERFEKALPVIMTSQSPVTGAMKASDTMEPVRSPISAQFAILRYLRYGNKTENGFAELTKNVNAKSAGFERYAYSQREVENALSGLKARGTVKVAQDGQALTLMLNVFSMTQSTTELAETVDAIYLYAFREYRDTLHSGSKFGNMDTFVGAIRSFLKTSGAGGHIYPAQVEAALAQMGREGVFPCVRDGAAVVIKYPERCTYSAERGFALKQTDTPQTGEEELSVPQDIQQEWLYQASKLLGRKQWFRGWNVTFRELELAFDDPRLANINAWHHFDLNTKEMFIVTRKGLPSDVKKAAIEVHEPGETSWQLTLGEKSEKGDARLEDFLRDPQVTIDRIAHTLISAQEREGKTTLIPYDLWQLEQLRKDPARLSRLLKEKNRKMQHEWVEHFISVKARRDIENYDKMFYAALQAEADRVGGIALTSQTADIQTQGDLNVKMPEQLAKEFEMSDGAGFRIVFIGAKQ